MSESTKQTPSTAEQVLKHWSALCLATPAAFKGVDGVVQFLLAGSHVQSFLCAEGKVEAIALEASGQVTVELDFTPSALIAISTQRSNFQAEYARGGLLIRGNYLKALCFVAALEKQRQVIALAD